MGPLTRDNSLWLVGHTVGVLPRHDFPPNMVGRAFFPRDLLLRAECQSYPSTSSRKGLHLIADGHGARASPGNVPKQAL